MMDEAKAIKCLNIIREYFDKFDNIEDYIRRQKLEKADSIPSSFPGMGMEDDLMNDFTIPPNDMEFELVELRSSHWNDYVNLISSHTNMTSIPGKVLKLAVKEKNTNKYVGFIRLGSPVINCKPRNQLLGKVPDLQPFNKSVIMGFVIVPAQPFGFNYLGGKLLAGICSSHYVREKLNKKYGMNLVMFETTSLYGNSKSSSQYDGMKPFLRNKGLTDSNFLPTIVGKDFDELAYLTDVKLDWSQSSAKMKMTNTIFSRIKKALPAEGLKEFNRISERAKKLIEQKRYYVSNYGIENYIDIVNGNTTEIKKSVAYDKYELDNIISWWKKKATKRYNKLKEEGRIREEVEVWSNGNDIDIIR
jgi:hypothetical protein